MSKTIPILLMLAAVVPAWAQVGETIQDPRGFSFQVPTGFRPKAMGGNTGLRGASVQAPDGSAALMVYNETGGLTPEACMDKCFSQVGPQSPTMVSSKTVSKQPYVVMREYTYPSNSGPGRLRMLFMAQDGLYRAYFVMASEQLFAKDEKALDGVVNSFQFTTPAAPARPTP